MNEPTPTPWRIVRTGDTIAVVGIDGKRVCDNEDYYPSPISEADAELIVRAVNLLNESRKVGANNTQPEANARLLSPPKTLLLDDWLKEEHEAALPDSSEMAGFAVDLLNAAMSEVNWHEIAEHLLED